ncbi:unnamed protein product [Phaedon cochleariae]|uniref:Uncharacterized protein n=1 Tax=Phaedon cochleariae TaxID=80249 RepID=A0A9P0GPG6_PHACE|nr:unnamed protein product [Phaedon cochleariae]
MVSEMEILFCLSVFLGITSTFAQMDESKYNVALKEFSKALHDECVKHHKVTDDEIWKLKTGIFDDNNDEMKNYVLCLWKESGTLDLSTFRLSKLLVEVYIPKELNNGDHVTMYLDCTTRGRELPTGTPLKERTWTVAKCLQQTDPENFVMF